MNHSKSPQPVQTLHGAPPPPLGGGATFAPQKPGKLLRLPCVMNITALGKSSIYAAVKAGNFPAPVRLSARAVAWRENSVYDWIAGRVTTKGQ